MPCFRRDVVRRSTSRAVILGAGVRVFWASWMPVLFFRPPPRPLSAPKGRSRLGTGARLIAAATDGPFPALATPTTISRSTSWATTSHRPSYCFSG